MRKCLGCSRGHICKDDCEFQLCRTCCNRSNNMCPAHAERENTKGPTRQDVTSEFTKNLCIPCNQTSIFSSLRSPHSDMRVVLQELQAASDRSVTEIPDSLSNDHVAKKKRYDTALPTCVDWSALPGPCRVFGADGQLGGKKKGNKLKNILQKNEARVERKERQCDAFVAVISALQLPPGSVIVDGGCGSCGLTLPLAWTFPHLTFVGIDMNPFATKLMMERVEAAKLKNVQAFTSSISAYTDHFDLAIGLHACGQASDDIINLAVLNQKPYLVAPCCFGKLKFSFRSHALPAALPNTVPVSMPAPAPTKRGPTPPKPIDENHCGYVARRLQENEGKWDALVYPRSSWLQAQLKTGAEDINRVTIRVATSLEKQRILLAKTDSGIGSAEDSSLTTMQPVLAATSFSERGDMRVLSLHERMESMYLTMAGFADNSHMRTFPEVDLCSSIGHSELPLSPSTPSVAPTVAVAVPKTAKQLKKETEHDLYRLCSNIICVDRNEFAVEKGGYSTRICTMPGLASSAKSDLLIGWLPLTSSSSC